MGTVLRLDIWPLGGHKRLVGPPITCLSGKGEPLKALVNLVRLSRPSHWLKNGFVLAALVFARKVTDVEAARGLPECRHPRIMDKGGRGTTCANG
jgi:hypothetical protein